MPKIFHIFLTAPWRMPPRPLPCVLQRHTSGDASAGGSQAVVEASPEAAPEASTITKLQAVAGHAASLNDVTSVP